MGYSVLLLGRYERSGPSSRVRHYNFLPALERAGFDVVSSPLLDDKYLDRMFRGERHSLIGIAAAYWRRILCLLSARRYDLIWIEKEALPWLPAAVERAFFGDRPVVIDYDDLWHLRYAQHPRALVRALLGHKLETLVTRVQAVTVGGPALAQWARSSKARQVIEMPPVVDLTRYPVRSPSDEPFTIGWIGTPGNEAYLALIAEPLRQLHDRFGARLRVIGGRRAVPVEGIEVVRVPWSEEHEGEHLAGCHVGVMPLVDGPWEHGKCAYKLIQYMAAGRPAVASPVGASTSVIVPGETGFFANTADEWANALGALAADRERGRTMGLAARARAEAKYSLAAAAPQLIEILVDAIAGTPRKRRQ